MLVVCPHCQANINIQIDLSLKLDGHELPVEPSPSSLMSQQVPDLGVTLLDPKRVAIAINGEGTREIIQEMLEGSQLEVIGAASLDELSPMLREFSPATVLVDLSLSGVMNVKLGEVIGKALSSEKARIILISPGYGKSNLTAEAQIEAFGASDYIERGNIQRDLVRKVKSHFDSPQILGGFGGQSEQMVSPPKEALPFIPKPSAMAQEVSPPALTTPPLIEMHSATPLFSSEAARLKAIESARRLARIIVSDIVLYNEKKVEEGVVNGTFYDVLKDEIDEGRRHYNARVPLDIQKDKDYLGDVFEDFLRRKKATTV
ncbi:MAG: hypothetical protein AAB317_01330 [Nitrospirota bacterium]